MNRRDFLSGVVVSSLAAQIPKAFADKAITESDIIWTVQLLNRNKILHVNAQFGDNVFEVKSKTSKYTRQKDIAICKEAVMDWIIEKRRIA